jgi:hypothetical protein
VQKYNSPSRQTVSSGVTCGRPSDRTVEIHDSSAAVGIAAIPTRQLDQLPHTLSSHVLHEARPQTVHWTDRSGTVREATLPTVVFVGDGVTLGK